MAAPLFSSQGQYFFIEFSLLGIFLCILNTYESYTTRCCFPWQNLEDDKCVMSRGMSMVKSMSMGKSNTNLKVVTSKPDCKATLFQEGKFKLQEGGAQVEGGKILTKEDYCIDRGTLRVCKGTADIR